MKMPNDRELLDIVRVDLRAVRELLTKPQPAYYTFNEDAAMRMLSRIIDRITNHIQPTLTDNEQ